MFIIWKLTCSSSCELSCSQEKRESCHLGFCTGYSSPLLGNGLGSELCGMTEGTSSALPSTPCCEVSSEVFVQQRYCKHSVCCGQEKSLSPTNHSRCKLDADEIFLPKKGKKREKKRRIIFYSWGLCYGSAGEEFREVM